MSKPQREAARRSLSMRWESSGCSERELGLGLILVRLILVRRLAMRAAGVAGFGAGTKRVVDDRLDRARAAPALHAAAEATIDVLGIPHHVGADGMANIVVAEDVAGTDDHES